MSKKFAGDVHLVAIDGDNEVTMHCDNVAIGMAVKHDAQDTDELLDAIEAAVSILTFALPASTSGFQLAKAVAQLRAERAQLKDRMETIINPSDDEFPF